MTADDQVEDWKSEGFVDATLYVKLLLSSDVYEKARAGAIEKSRTDPMVIRWPWVLPEGIEQYSIVDHDHGTWMIFVNPTREIYVCWR